MPCAAAYPIFCGQYGRTLHSGQLLQGNTAQKKEAVLPEKGFNNGNCKKILNTARVRRFRLPKKFRFNSDEVVIQQLGDAVILVPKESAWQTFLEGLDSFTPDIFADGRDQGTQEERESL